MKGVDDNGHAVLVDVVAGGGDPGQPVILYKGGLLVRDLKSSGYGQAIVDQNKKSNGGASGPEVVEYVSQKVIAPLSREKQSLRLSVEMAPVYITPEASDMVVVPSALPDGAAQDHTQIIRDALARANAEGKRPWLLSPAKFITSRTPLKYQVACVASWVTTRFYGQIAVP
ncbi:MAG: hypothetical protein HC904_08905 [Blastochloris sp.]|nr:hypothetical protein [Blastochloris sp.]